MEKYYILTLESGQPVILYQKQDTVYMYSIISGRIRSFGIVFEEVTGELHTLFCQSHYIGYISKKGQIKLSVFKNMRFIEILSLPTENLSYYEAIQIHLIQFSNEVILLYLIHNSNDSSNSLFCVRKSSLQKSARIATADYSYNNFSLMDLGNQLEIYLHNDTNRKIYVMNADMSIKNISSLKTDSKESPDSHTIGQMKNDLTKKEKELTDANKTIYELKNEIAGLKSTQKHISDQYNELADFAGQLQEALRKTRFY